jgi:hypothetical protein
MTLKWFIYAPQKWQQDLINSGLSWSAKHGNFTPWIGQTYLELSQIGWKFTITENLDVEGIVLADRDSLGNRYPFLSKTILICTKSDRAFHPSAHFHISHNRNDENNFFYQKIWRPRFIHHWPIPELKPRDTIRGNKIQNVAYVGHPSQLATQLQSSKWNQQVKELGLQWMTIFDPAQWNDYTNIDVVIAARRLPTPSYLTKGSIKLLNCWNAGVPALLAPESAFLAERQSQYDFLIINSADEAYRQLQFLTDHPEFYAHMLERCRQCAIKVNRDSIRSEWLRFFKEVEAYYDYWVSLSEKHKKTAFLIRRYFPQYQRAANKLEYLVKSYLYKLVRLDK